MSKSSIEWTGYSWDPIVGCSKVSQGCKHCYAEVRANHLQAMGTRGYDGLIKTLANGQPAWTGKINCVEEALVLPFTRKKPTTWFVNSMSDCFHEDVPFGFLDKIFAVMWQCPQHTFQILTKRPARMKEYIEDDSLVERLDSILEESDKLAAVTLPLDNVWLGVSVEDQATADERVPLLLQTDAAVRFISAEPLLGAVDLKYYLSAPAYSYASNVRYYIAKCNHCGFLSSTQHWYGGNQIADTGDYNGIFCPKCLDIYNEGYEPQEPHYNGYYPKEDDCEEFERGLDWVIVGGESGLSKGIRPINPDWVRAIQRQCAEAKTAFFFKQWGEYAPIETLEGEIMRRVGKKAAGNHLDGKQYLEYPK